MLSSKPPYVSKTSSRTSIGSTKNLSRNDLSMLKIVKWAAVIHLFLLNQVKSSSMKFCQSFKYVFGNFIILQWLSNCFISMHSEIFHYNHVVRLTNLINKLWMKVGLLPIVSTRFFISYNGLCMSCSVLNTGSSLMTSDTSSWSPRGTFITIDK